MNLMVQIHLLNIFPLVLVEPNPVAVAASVYIEIQSSANFGFSHQASAVYAKIGAAVINNRQ